MNADYWPAPAKINLFLRITGRRADGYHDLQTLFQFLDLHDRLYFSPSRRGDLSLQGNYRAAPGKEDLILRAARALRQAAGCANGAQIRVEKHLPMGGGLGGGSSNAATTLRALNLLWDTGLTVDELAAIGLSLGADVPVFVRGQAAWAEGVGERLRAVTTLPEQPYLLVWPDCAVETARIFSAPDLTRDSPAITIEDFLSGDSRNDCEPVVRKNYRRIDEAMRWLDGRLSDERLSESNASAAAKLTGTGGCVFAAFPSLERARAARAELPPQWQGFVTRGLNRSPLLERITRYNVDQDNGV